MCTQEPNNLKGRNSFRYNGLVQRRTVGVELSSDGKAVVLVTKNAQCRSLIFCHCGGVDRHVNWGRPHLSLPLLPPLFSSLLFFFSYFLFFFHFPFYHHSLFLEVGPLNSSYRTWGSHWAFTARFGARPQPKLHLVHCSIEMCDLVAKILIIFPSF